MSKKPSFSVNVEPRIHASIRFWEGTMADSKPAKNKLQQSVSDSAFAASEIVNDAVKANVAKSAAIFMKPSLDALNTAVSKPL